MERLREKVGEGDGVDGVAGAREGAQIASKRGWIAGNIDECRRCNPGELRGRLCAEPGARGVDNNQIGPVTF